MSSSRPTKEWFTRSAKGGPVFGSGDELTAGEPDDAEKKEGAKGKDAKKETAKKDNATQENRFLMVTVAFDPSLIVKPESMLEKKPAIKPTGLVDIPDKAVRPRPQRSQASRRGEGSQGKSRPREGRL